MRQYLSIGLLLTYALVLIHHWSIHHHHESTNVKYHSQNELIEHLHHHVFHGMDDCFNVLNEGHEHHEDHKHVLHLHQDEEEFLRRNIDCFSQVFLINVFNFLPLTEQATTCKYHVESDAIKLLSQSSVRVTRGPPIYA